MFMYQKLKINKNFVNKDFCRKFQFIFDSYHFNTIKINRSEFIEYWDY